MKSQDEHAILKRINRKLRHENERVHKTLPSTMKREPRFGQYHMVDVSKNALILYDVDINELAKELGVDGMPKPMPIEPRRGSIAKNPPVADTDHRVLPTH